MSKNKSLSVSNSSDLEASWEGNGDTSKLCVHAYGAQDPKIQLCMQFAPGCFSVLALNLPPSFSGSSADAYGKNEKINMAGHSAQLARWPERVM